MILFFFNDTATTEIYTLSLHDALPILISVKTVPKPARRPIPVAISMEASFRGRRSSRPGRRSEEHTSELQSRQYLVCRLLLEKKKKRTTASLNSQDGLLTDVDSTRVVF